MMYCIQFVEAFVRDRERKLRAAARDPRGRKVTRRFAGSGTHAQADTTVRLRVDGGGRASAEQPCCTPAAA